MSITIQQLQENIQKARAQEKSHRDDAAACAGAAQAYEHLLSQMLKDLRDENAAKIESAPKAAGPEVIKKPTKKRR